MKLEIEACRTAFKIIDQVTSHAGLLSSQFIRLQYSKDKLYLNLSGMAIGSANIPATDGGGTPWTFYMDRRVLAAFLSTTQAKAIELVLEKDSLTLKAGRQKATVAGMSAVAGYTSWKRSPSVKTLKLSEHLKKELGMLANYAPTTSAADHLMAVYLIKGYGILSTDSFCLASCLDSSISETFPLPVVLAQLAAASQSSQLYIEKAGGGMVFPQGYIYQAVSARTQTDYPMVPVKKVVAARIVDKPMVKLPIKRLAEGFDYLKNFIFGADTGIFVELSGKQADKTLRISMKSPAGEVNKVLSDGEILVPEFSIRWPIAKAGPWVAYQAGIDADALVHCGKDADGAFLTTGTPKKKNLLVIAENAE